MIEVTYSSTDYLITATSVEYDITVSSDNTLFTVTDQTSNFTIETEENNIVFYTDGVGGFDFAGKFLGPWVSGTEYQRNDVVSYNYSIYINQIPFLSVYTSTIAPPNDPTKWELFYFHESTMSYAIITNTATIGGNTDIGGNLTVGPNNWFSVTQTTDPISGAYRSVTLSNAGLDIEDQNNVSLDVQGSLTATGATFSGLVTVGNGVDVTGYSLFRDQVQISGPLDVNGEGNFSQRIVSSTGTSTFYDLTVNRQFTLGNLRFPLNAGVDGQILKTNGSNQASWVNLGDLVFWNLSDDLQTNGFNIQTGYEAGVPNPQLTIGSGLRGVGYKSYIQLEETPQAQIGGDIDIRARTVYFRQPEADTTPLNADVRVIGNLNVSDNVYGNYINSNNGADLSGTNIDINGRLRINSAASFNSALALTGYSRSTGVPNLISVTPGFRFPDGTMLTSTNFTSTGTGTLVLPIATTSTLGGVIVGDYLTITEAGLLSVDTSTIATNISTATTTTLGVVKIGQYIDITGDGTISVNTSSLGSALLPAATTSTLGGIIVGEYLDITEGGVLSVNTTSLGTLAYTLPIATTSTLGGVKVGSGLSINTTTGVLSTTPQGIISLTEDMLTNGYNIRVNNFYPGIRFRLDSASAKMEKDNTLFAAFDTTATIIASSQIDINAPIVEIGPDPTQSRLHVSRIYNWAGVGPPFFPAGIQFGDQSVQLTAYYPNDFGPIIATSVAGLEQQARAVDFNNLSLAVDYNLV